MSCEVYNGISLSVEEKGKIPSGSGRGVAYLVMLGLCHYLNYSTSNRAQRMLTLHLSIRDICVSTPRPPSCYTHPYILFCMDQVLIH